MTALLSLKLPDDINRATVYLLLAETARCPDVFAVQKLNERQLAALKKARETVEHNSLKKEKGMEGIVGKRHNSTYKTNHRSHDWLKYKHFKITDAVILGYKENPFSMLVGKQLSNGKYKSLANVEFGFKPEEKIAFRQISSQIITKVERDITWIEPRLHCKIQYLERTASGSLRIVSFKGFNFDNTLAEVAK